MVARMDPYLSRFDIFLQLTANKYDVVELYG